MPKRLLHTMIRVGDLERSIKFYTEALGMRFLRKWDCPEDKFTLAFLGYGTEADSSVLELTYNYGQTEYKHGDAYGHIAIGVDDMATEVARLKEMKVPFDYEAEDGFMAFIVDPDGYYIELLDTKRMIQKAEQHMKEQAKGKMLGVGTWFTAIMIPSVTVGGFLASRKRLALQWREELMDPEGNIYPSVTDAEMAFARRVSPGYAPHSGGEQMTAKDNIGLHVSPHALTEEETHVLLDEVARWVPLFGQPIDPRRAEHFAQTVRHECARVGSDTEMPLDTHFYRHVSIISDHAEDTQMMKAPWGTGDRLRQESMPSTLRFLIQKTHQQFERLGRLRHVYVEYSPSGKLYHDPRPTKAFDGHDYVMIPLRRDQCATVVTLSPLLRSRHAFVKEIIRNSWTSRDVDVMIPSGGMMRVYGTMRYEWGWGIRPGDVWFGHYRNNVQHATGALHSWGHEARRVWDAWRCRGKDEESNDAAMVVLHFEGPRGTNKKRSLLLHPELLIFGSPPTPETYERWYDDRPTADAVAKEGVLLFVLKNYLNMLRVS